MRKESFVVGDYVHIYNRGSRKMAIVYDDHDKWRFLKNLRFFNDEYSPQNIFRDLSLFRQSSSLGPFERPLSWPTHKPLVRILCFCLMPNHFHLLIKEIIEGGTTKFMRKLGTGFTNFINTKYGESGNIFQGSYKAKVVRDARHLQYLTTYIQLLNPFELYPGDTKIILKDFNKLFEFAVAYRFGSLPDFIGRRNFHIIEKDIFEKMFETEKAYQEFAREAVLERGLKNILKEIAID